MRIILYTGKGGTGKTSVAAATAVRSAELGYRTIAISADAAHSLGDSFDVNVGNGPTPIITNLAAQETDVYHEMEAHWNVVQTWLIALLSHGGISEIQASEMTVLPGMEELASLLTILDYYDSGNYDVIIIDCAPTGETLRLLSFPEVLHWWIRKLFPLKSRMLKVLKPVLTPVLNIPYPDERLFQALQEMYNKAFRVFHLLTNPEIVTVRLVVNPEKMVIKEAHRSFTYLNLYGYFTDLIVCNRVIPETTADHFFVSLKESQGKYLKQIEESFAPLPIFTAPLFDREVVGLPMLKQMGIALFEDNDPSQFFYRGRAREFIKENGRNLLVLPLPFLEKEEISLLRSGNELTVHAGQYRRNVILPHALAGLTPRKARFEENKLYIEFIEEEEVVK